MVGDLWADETDGKCQMHFRVRMADGTRFQVDQPISRQRYNLFVGYKLDAHRVDLIEKVLHGNKSGLCIRKWVATELLHMKGAEKACAYIEKKADSHLSRLVSRMEWFPVKYHLLDKVALVVFTILGYFTGKHHLDDDLVFLWLLAGMPILFMTVIWGVNELCGWINGK